MGFSPTVQTVVERLRSLKNSNGFQEQEHVYLYHLVARYRNHCCVICFVCVCVCVCVLLLLLFFY